MNNLLSSFLIAISLPLSVTVKAANTDSMTNLQLAMLTLSGNKATVAQLTKKIKTKRIKVIKPPIVIYPANCLKWNATQINRKAKNHSKPITKYSRLHRVDSNLIKSIITAESCFRIKALSNKGASGLMQLIPATAERFGVKNIYSPEQNIRGGTKYLKFLLARYKGDLRKTIAAYNAGEGAVDKYKGIPPYRETQNYVKNVLKIYRMLTPKKVNKKKRKVVKTKGRVHAVYQPPKLGRKPGRHGWKYNKRLAPHLYKH